jgi:hypothetical protein
MNAIEFLIKEHNQVRAMFADISDDNHKYETQRKRFDILSEELLRHENMEHSVWYPHFKNKISPEVEHLLKEEAYAEKAIKYLQTLKSETAWKEHFLKLKSDVEHHATEEETLLFPEVEKLLSEQKLEEIGLQMYHYKKEH